jgi:hypothetical protein
VTVTANYGLQVIEKLKNENHGAQPVVTDNDHSCHGLCCAHSAPAVVMSDLKRWAKKNEHRKAHC